MGRDMAVALSLANLCLVRVWGRVVCYGSADAFHMKCAPGSGSILAAGANLALLWAAVWALVVLRRNRRRWLAFAARAGLVAVVLVALNAVRAVAAGQFPNARGAILTSLGPNLEIVSAAGLAALVAVVLFRAGPRVRRWGARALLTLTPLAPMMLIGAAVHLVQPSRYELATPRLSAPLPGPTPRIRAVWVIFDEWDFRTAFEARPPELRTPHLDRLVQQSLFATEAVAPANETVESIPALLLGERFVEVERSGPAELWLRRAGGPAPIRWDAGRSVLGRARERGINAAAAGWYLPYCRLLAPVVTACDWSEMAPADESCTALRAPVPQLMANQMRSLFQTGRFSLLGQSQGFHGFVRSYRELAEAGVRMAADAGLGLVFLHLPIPHAAGLRADPDGALAPGSQADTLALVDQTVGRLVAAVSSAGLWRSTHLLLSSDHSLRGVRQPDPRIPFILHLAGEHPGRIYANRFNTVVSGELLLRALAGEVATYDAAARWLDGQR
jgi:hypothetical protein